MSRTLKSDTLDIENMVDLGLTLFETSDPWMKVQGAEWYPVTNAFARQLSDETGHSIEAVAAVIAATSPQTRWADNMVDAANVLHDRAKRSGAMDSNIQRAQRVLLADDPIDELTRGSKSGKRGGPKMFAFARNILGYVDDVTVDVWMVRALLGLTWRVEDETDYASKVIGWVGAYGRMAEAIRRIATLANVPAPVVQATIWIAIRGKAD